MALLEVRHRIAEMSIERMAHIRSLYRMENVATDPPDSAHVRIAITDRMQKQRALETVGTALRREQ